MTESKHPQHRLAVLARVRDEDLAGLESGAAAQSLLASVVAEPVESAAHVDPPQPARRWQGGRAVRRLAVAAAAIGTMTVAAVFGPSMLEDGTGGASSYANSAIEITREGDLFVARIKDPLADQARYVEAFRAVGQDVHIELVPVPPNRIGQLLEVSSSGSVRRASTDLVSSGPTPVDCALKPASCTMVIRISTDTTGEVRYKLGRAARPGEAYRDPGARPDVVPAPRESSGGSAD